MADFTDSWLALREPADSRARSRELADRLVQWLAARSTPTPESPLRVLDLGCGTGSNLRWLAPRLGMDQHWTCLDRDPDLLAALTPETIAWARGLGLTAESAPDGLHIAGKVSCWQVETLPFDLARGAAALTLAPGALVSASALLDLVSEAWLLGLLRACLTTGSPLLCTLTYDGRVELEPHHRLDGPVVGLVNAHQGRDKGLGPALGPSAPARLGYLAGHLNLRVESVDSDWELGPDEIALQQALVAGWADAALEQAADSGHTKPGLDPGALIADWCTARLEWIAAGCSQIRVGHQDSLVLPA